MLTNAIGAEDFVWLLGSLAQIHRVPFDPALVLQRYPAPHTVRQLHEAARSLGFRTGEQAATRAGLNGARLPCVGFLKSGEAVRPVILARAESEQVLYFAPGSPEAQSAPLDAFGETFEPAVLPVRPGDRGEEHLERDTVPAASKFGFRWFAAELLRHRRIWRDVLLASASIQLIGLAMPLGTQVILDKVVVHQTTSTLAVVAVALGVFVLFNAGMSWLRQYLVVHTGNRVDAVLGSAVFRHLLRLYLPYFEHRPTGTLVARLQAVETIREFVAGAAASVLLDLPFLAVFLAVMFWYSWELSLIALGAVALIAGISAAVTPLLRKRINRQFLLGARNQAFLTEYVAGIETVKSLQMEPRLEDRYDDYLASYLSASFATRQLSNTYNVIANALEQAMTVAILCAGALLVMRNDGFSIGMLVAFQMFAARLSQPMLRLASLWQEFQQANIAVRRLGDVMDAPAEPVSLAPSRAPGGKGEVQVRDLAFRYSERHPWLFRGLSLVLRPGKLTVLTGPSGAGKSTLAKLLLGFYQPEEGAIEIDGRDLRYFAANELRAHFGVVPQETFLFSGTVYENLIAANPNAGFDDVVHACKIAEIHRVIEKLPQGYNTPIGEHGVGLSGGQKQRLAIARAILKRPKILVFDEATSSLDPHTAEAFARTVNKLKAAAAILFIAHHVPKGLAVDEIVTLNGEKASPTGAVDGEGGKNGDESS